VAPAYVYFASDDATYTTGEVLGITGGKPVSWAGRSTAKPSPAPSRPARPRPARPRPCAAPLSAAPDSGAPAQRCPAKPGPAKPGSVNRAGLADRASRSTGQPWSA